MHSHSGSMPDRNALVQTPTPLLVYLSGLHSRLPKAEVSACGGRLIAENGRLLAVEIESESLLLKLGYSSMLLEFLGISSSWRRLPFDPARLVQPYAIKTASVPGYSGLSDSKSVVEDLVWHSLGDPQVDLSDPETVLHAFVTGSSVWWGRLIHRFLPAEFEDRAVQQRPFFRSVGVPPRKARCLVNLSGVKPGQLLLDPFCGTGSFLIEAALAGAAVCGSDLDPAMVLGTRRNLDHFALSGDIRMMDARALEQWGVRFDALVTDVPYGRSASLKGADQSSLYGEFLESCAGVLKEGARAAIMAPQGMVVPPKGLFTTIDVFEEYVHGSLTREILVLERT